MNRPRVALIATTYFRGSHADVAGGRLLEGYSWEGRQIDSRVEVVSVYLEQLGDHAAASGPRPDIGVEITDRLGVPRYPTVAEAIGCGRGGVQVDGVIIVGEHGDYEENVLGQKLYPRRRLFDSAVSAMIAAGTVVPVFTDKHLSWSFADARAMYETAQRLDLPLLAGSSVPLTWRIPTGTQWPMGEPMSDIVTIGYGPTEIYGFHILEAMQVHAERRAGGEGGVVGVQALTGAEAAQALADGTVDSELFEQALATFDLDDDRRTRARTAPQDVFLVEYADGLRAAVVNCHGALKGFAAAARGPGHEMTCHMWTQGPPDHGHFVFLVRQIESLMLSGRAPYPVERTLLTTGVLDAAMHSRYDGGTRVATPELAIAYQPTLMVPDTGVDRPIPGGAPGLEG